MDRYSGHTSISKHSHLDSKCSDTSDLPRAVRTLKPTLDYAAAHNIVVNLENDDPILSSDKRILEAIRLADRA